MPLAAVEGSHSLKFFRSTSCLSRPATSPCNLSSCLRTDRTYCAFASLEAAGFGLVLESPTTETGPFAPERFFVGPDFFWFLRLGRRCGILGCGQRRRGTAVLRLRDSGEGREKRQDYCERGRTGHAASSLFTSRTLSS